MVGVGDAPVARPRELERWREERAVQAAIIKGNSRKVQRHERLQPKDQSGPRAGDDDTAQRYGHTRVGGHSGADQGNGDQVAAGQPGCPTVYQEQIPRQHLHFSKGACAKQRR